MADKKKYNVVLQPGVDKEHFLHHGDGCNCECASHLESIPSIVVMRLTDDEVTTLLASSDVVAVEQEFSATPDSVSFKIRAGQTFITGDTPSTGTPGSDYSNMHFHWFSNTADIPTGTTPGWFTNQGETDSIPNQDIRQTFAGEYVDIVAIEVGDPGLTSSLNSWLNHPDFLDDEGNTRFIPMDWSTVSSSVDTRANNQITNGVYFDSHAIGVLSAAGGKYNGWAPKSTLRVIYINSEPSPDTRSDLATEVYNTVATWHQTKPINPLTGKRNATVTTGSWGYTHLTLNEMVAVDEVAQIIAYDILGNETIISRPGASWGTDFTPFTDNGIIPRIVLNQTSTGYQWMIAGNYNARNLSWDSVQESYASIAGLYHFKSMGNEGATLASPLDPRNATRVITDATHTLLDTGVNTSTYQFNWVSLTSASTLYPFKSYTAGQSTGGTSTMYISASQHSTTNPLLDDYSSRGPAATMSGMGSFSWTAYPGSTFSDGFSWNYFGGTSNAAPSVAGVAACIVGWWLAKYGTYPTGTELTNFMLQNAQNIVTDESTVDWANVPAAGLFSNSNLYSANDVYRIANGQFANGSSSISDFAFNTTSRAFLPDSVRLDYAYNLPEVRTKTLGTRPATGQCYPRRKIKIG